MAYIRNAAEDLKNIFKLNTSALQLKALSNSKGYTEEWSTTKVHSTKMVATLDDHKMNPVQKFWAVERKQGNNSEITDYSCLMEPHNAKGLDELWNQENGSSIWYNQLCPLELKKLKQAKRTKLFCARNDSERAAILLVAWDDYYDSNGSNKDKWNRKWVDDIPTEMLAGTLMMMSIWARELVLSAFTSKNHKRTITEINARSPKRFLAEMKWKRSETEMKNGAAKKERSVTSGNGNTAVEAKETAAKDLLEKLTISGVELLLSASAPIRWRRLEAGILRDLKWKQLEGTSALPRKGSVEALAAMSDEDRADALAAMTDDKKAKALAALSDEERAKALAALAALSDEDRADALAAMTDAEGQSCKEALEQIAWMQPQAKYGEPGIIDSAFWLVFSKVSIDEMQKYNYNIDSLASTSTLVEAGCKKDDEGELVEDPTYYCLEKGTVGFYKMPEDYFKEIFDMKSEKAIDEMDEDGSFSKAKCSMWTRAQQENMCFYKRKETATHQFIKVDPELFDALCNKFGPDSHGTYSMKPGASAAGTGGLNAQPRRARPTQSDLIAFVQKKLDNKELEVEQHFKHMVFARKVKFKETIMITECDHGFDDDVHDVFAFQATENHVGEMFVCAGDLFKVNFKQDTKEIRDIVAHGANAFKQNFVAFTKQH